MHSSGASPSADLFCPACGYNLREIESEQCPECGLAVDRETVSRSVIPWTHRAHIGRGVAFIRTILFVTRRAGWRVGDTSGPVSLSDAQRFRWIVVIVASLPLIAAATTLRWFLKNMPYPSFGLGNWQRDDIGMNPLTDVAICLFAAAQMWVVPSILIVLYTIVFTGAASYFFHPRSLSTVQQNRAIATSYYACAPLSFMFIAVALLTVAAAMSAGGMTDGRGGFRIMTLLLYLGIALPAALVAVMWFATLRILHDSTHCMRGRLVTVAVLLPLVWLVLAILFLVILPAMIGFVRLLIDSYRS
ncbi:MAG TPA: zinc ribbon domain-containing protein [Tepidisphaeraceae bacterium]